MEKIHELQQQFAAFLDTVDLMGTPRGLYEPVAYTVLQQGKRMRPMLCLLANDLFGGKLEDALYPALALETAHNFTLIHDDIMDQAPLRRGKETVYKKWDANTAILSGDAAIFMAYQFAQRTPRPAETVALLSKVMLEVCEGQQYDMDFESQAVVSIPEYLEMIRLKTAVLLATSLEMGAVVAGASEADRRNVYDFGIALGMAFQLMDDLLDCYSDVKVFGKVTGGDIVENKKTMMLLKALELGSDEDRHCLDALYASRQTMEAQEKIARVLAVYDRLHVKEAVERLMAEYYREADRCLDLVNQPEERKKPLRAYAAMLSGRNK